MARTQINRFMSRIRESLTVWEVRGYLMSEKVVRLRSDWGKYEDLICSIQLSMLHFRLAAILFLTRIHFIGGS